MALHDRKWRRRQVFAAAGVCYGFTAERSLLLCMKYYSSQLQRLMSSLQLSARGAVSTGELTRSFGWRDSEAFVQHDVQVRWHLKLSNFDYICSHSGFVLAGVHVCDFRTLGKWLR